MATRRCLADRAWGCWVGAVTSGFRLSIPDRCVHVCVFLCVYVCVCVCGRARV